VTPLERQGYLFWLPTILILLTFEVLGAVTSWFGNAIPWPTLSMTVGRLEKRWPIVALVVVAVIAAALFHTLAYRRDTHRAGGRRVRPGTHTKPLNVYGWWFVLGLSAAAFFLAWAAGATTYEYGYAIYGTVLGLGFVVPGVLLVMFHRVVAFPPLFQTATDLQKRLHFVTLVLTTGLTILAVHLAFYPWPDITHESATFAGRNPEQARSDAEQALRQLRQGKPTLAYSTQAKGILDGTDAWDVYFADSCVIVETKAAITHSPQCER